MPAPTSNDSLQKIFGHLPSEGLAAVAALFSPRTVERNQPVLRQGDTWDTASIIHRGLVRMAFTRRDGREFNKSFHFDGMLVCPITEAMIRQPSLFSIHTVEPCLLLQAPAARLRECLSDFQAWEPLRTQLLERLVTHKLEREYHLLVMDGRTRYAHFCASAPQLAGRVPLAQLATYLGMTDVSLSRIRRNSRPDSSGKSPTATG